MQLNTEECVMIWNHYAFNSQNDNAQTEQKYHHTHTEQIIINATE